jgi:hypothetical protein
MHKAQTTMAQGTKTNQELNEVTQLGQVVYPFDV